MSILIHLFAAVVMVALGYWLQGLTHGTST
jgi:hypothetical protein